MIEFCFKLVSDLGHSNPELYLKKCWAVYMHTCKHMSTRHGAATKPLTQHVNAMTLKKESIQQNGYFSVAWLGKWFLLLPTLLGKGEQAGTFQLGNSRDFLAVSVAATVNITVSRLCPDTCRAALVKARSLAYSAFPPVWTLDLSRAQLLSLAFCRPKALFLISSLDFSLK